MPWLSNIINAVKSYFAPKPSTPAPASFPKAPTPSYQSTKAPSYTAQIQKQNYPTSTAKPPTPSANISRAPSSAPSVPSYSSPSSGSSVPSTTSAPQVSAPAPRQETPTPSLAGRVAPIIGGVGKALTSVGTALNAPQIIPGGLGAQGQSWAGQQGLIEKARNLGIPELLPEAFRQYSEAAGSLSPEEIAKSQSSKSANYGQLGESALNSVWGGYSPEWLQTIKDNLGKELLASTLWAKLGNAAQNFGVFNNSPKGKLLPSAASTQMGQILPSAASTGPMRGVARNIVPSPVPQTRGSAIPSAVQPSSLPANMQGLTQSNVNPEIAKAINPEAIQAIGQLLLRSLVGNQSTLTSMNPGIAQALWGAPTAFNSFGGYDGTAAVPNQSRVRQEKNLPPVPQAVGQG